MFWHFYSFWVLITSRLNILCFIKLSWHGAKNSCCRASSALILRLGFTIRHLSTRSNSDLGICLKNWPLFVLALHQLCSVIDGKNLISSNSWENRKQLDFQCSRNLNNGKATIQQKKRSVEHIYEINLELRCKSYWFRIFRRCLLYRFSVFSVFLFRKQEAKQKSNQKRYRWKWGFTVVQLGHFP